MTFRPYDRWVYTRLLSVREINGELDRVSDALRPLARANPILTANNLEVTSVTVQSP